MVTSDEEETVCTPGGMSMGQEPACKDSLFCDLGSVQVPHGRYKVRIVDIDSLEDDLVGEGWCESDAAWPCRVGAAVVTFGKVPQESSPAAVAPPSASKVPEYRVALRENKSLAGVKRLSFRIVVAQGTGAAGLEAIARVLVEEEKRRGPIAACAFFFYSDPDTVEYAYTVGLVEWLPDGDWRKAMEVQPGDYSRHTFGVRVGSATGLEPFEPELNKGMPERSRKEIYWRVAEAETLAAIGGEESSLPRKLKVAKRYGISEAQLLEIVLEGNTKSWPMP